MKVPYSLFLVLLLALTLPQATAAAVVVRTGEVVEVTTDQTIADDFYAAGNRVIMSGTVGGDMLAAAGSVTVNGTINNDLIAFGGRASVHASVTDDIRIAAGDVVIAEPVGGDVFVMGGEVAILSTASVGGDVFVLAGEVSIDAPVAGSVMGRAESMRIDDAIGGDVDVKIADDLVLGERASVSGNVSYTSPNEIVRSQGAVVEGNVVKNSAPVVAAHESTVLALLTPLFALLFGSLVTFLFFRPQLERLVPAVLSQPSRNALVGLGMVLVAPVVLFFLLISILGSLVGLLGMFGLGFLYISALILLPVVAGGLIARSYQPRIPVTLISIAVGAVVIVALVFIPILGVLLVFALYVITLGGLAVAAYERLRAQR